MILFRWVRGLLAAFGLLVFLVTVTPFDAWYGRVLSGEWYAPQGDILIVLGGSTLGREMLGESSYWRSVYAVRDQREGLFRRIVLSGGTPEAPVAELMRDFLVCQGVPPGIIQVEGTSRSTRENALFVQQLLAGTPGRKILVTSDYHMFRALRAFRKAGLEVTPVPFPDAGKRGNAWQNRWSVFLELAKETLKIGYYRARGWI